MMQWLKKHEWDVVAGAAILGFVLGIAGFWQFLYAAEKTASIPDFLYFGFRLFLFNYDLPGDGVPYAQTNAALEVARFLTPATVFYTAIRGVALSLAGQVGLWKIRNWGGHAVVAGGGKRGSELALSLLRTGWKVAVVDSDAACEYQTQHPQAGGRFILGDIRSEDLQRQARLGTAALVVAVTSSEETNLEVALKAGQRIGEEPVRILTHAPRRFSEIFEDRPPFDRQHGVVETRFFNYDANAARALLLEVAPDLVGVPFASGAPRILLVGDSPFLAELLAHALTQCQYAFAGAPQFVVLADGRDRFDLRMPLGQGSPMPLVAAVEVRVATAPEMLRPPVELLGAFDMAFVAFVNDLDTLQSARHLALAGGAPVARIFACVRPSHDLAGMFGDQAVVPGAEVRDLVQLGCTLEAVVNGTLDADARTIHESYLAEEAAKGNTPGKDPMNKVLVPWSELAESYRGANRAQADGKVIKRRQLKLCAAGEGVEPLVEAMAEAEHRRWMAERILAGWRFAPVRDNARKLHPSIKPYAELSEPEKQKDRDTVNAVRREIR